MKVLVTGSAGFIGSHICKALLDGGHEIICLDNFDPYYSPEYKKGNIAGLDLELVEGSVNDLPLLQEICKDTDLVYHEAAQAGVRVSVENPLKSYKVNIEGMLNVLLAAQNGHVKKVVNASSSSVYGLLEYTPIDEKHPKSPLSPYGVSKLIAERYSKVFSDLYGINVANLRYFTVYGPRMRPDLAISIFIKNALKNEPIHIFGDGKKTRDFTYIDDIVEANMLLMKKGSGNFNIGTGNNFSITDMVNKILDITGSSSKIVYEENARGDVQDTLADPSKAKKELGWEAKISFDEGLRRVVEAIKNEESRVNL